jgi:flagellar protein FliO/FliZ
MPKDLFALLGMLLTVVLILVLAYLSTKYLSRLKLGGFSSFPSGGRMRLLDQLSMGADLRLVLVQVGARYLLLGLSSAGITQLGELSPEEAALWEEETLGGPAGPSQVPPSFRASVLEALRQKRK